MNSSILKISKVTKKYKNINVLDNVNMTIKKGQIYGLIGLNGAGKSTLIRIITGLVSEDSGSVELFGEHEKDKIENSRKRIGAIIETPALYENKTAYENIHINRIQKGIPGEDCIEKVLNMVGLNDIKDKKVKTLSLGTKQILGIAMALLGEPEFLILDEPINALDPIRIIEIRELLKRLNEEYGVTMLISSHILGELYHIANHYGIIHKGKLIEEITIDELNDRCKKFIHIKVDNSANAAVILNKKLNTLNYNVFPGNVIKLYDYIEESGKVTEILVKEGVTVEQIMPMGEDLETYFSEVIGGLENV
ncbi:bacitracin ABC transporter ATP-binding protein [Clostridium carboxidivorans P7]|uniref:ABC transporter related protein n=1 Tax=Clostridium carboxidivorans P7 TaxID=536227 RepID=C6PN12_9CLOT|nr:ATP-binding cassette domain-containing protein [Clostridium carboxidivorans]AKN30881.1 bacitracin ABC transporter ATP-binding protein [Clostridium carboxidivorans P7]EET89345.1 ABC transporter related protein [Clostridium carboxidivorans P7]EFG88871.1 putative bacitracin transport ATP-binding protein BcrA [Clostridium carboxidivorans P7]